MQPFIIFVSISCTLFFMDIRRFRDSYYLVYSDGRVYSEKSGLFLSVTDNNGYKMYSMTFGSKGARYKKKLYAHRVVAEVFLDRIDGKHQVNHRNGIKADNRVENLEWCTREENMNHAIATGLVKINVDEWIKKKRVKKERVYVEKKKRRVFSDVELLDIRSRGVSGDDLLVLGKEYGVSISVIYNIVNGIGKYWFDGVRRSELIKIRAEENKRIKEERSRGCREKIFSVVPNDIEESCWSRLSIDNYNDIKQQIPSGLAKGI